MGSGDLMSWADVERLFATTGVQGAFIARGAMGNPWIFRRADYTPTSGRTRRRGARAGAD